MSICKLAYNRRVELEIMNTFYAHDNVRIYSIKYQEEKAMKYNTTAEVFDIGPFITKVILELEQTITDCEIGKDTFRVSVARKDR